MLITMIAMCLLMKLFQKLPNNLTLQKVATMRPCLARQKSNARIQMILYKSKSTLI